MKLRSRRVLDAVHGPGPAALQEAGVVFGMPVTGGHDGCSVPLSSLDPGVQDNYDLVAFGNGQCSARAEITLHVDHQQCVVRTELETRLRCHDSMDCVSLATPRKWWPVACLFPLRFGVTRQERIYEACRGRADQRRDPE